MEHIICHDEQEKFKSKGIIAQKQPGYFSIRFIGQASQFTVNEMRILCDIADTYGDGNLSLTNRGTIEIPYIAYENIDKAIYAANKNSLTIDLGGANVRAVSSCKGSVCPNGLIDVKRLSLDIEKKLLGKKLPSKFKIAVVGCVNGYGKAQTNDIGILPVRSIKINHEKCVLCGKCESYCKENALQVVEGKITLNEQLCCSCGGCSRVCPIEAIEKDKVELLLFIGGKLGRKANLAKPMKRRFKEEEIVPTIENIITYFCKNANKGERLASLINRLGRAELENNIIK